MLARPHLWQQPLYTIRMPQREKTKSEIEIKLRVTNLPEILHKIKNLRAARHPPTPPPPPQNAPPPPHRNPSQPQHCIQSRRGTCNPHRESPSSARPKHQPNPLQNPRRTRTIRPPVVPPIRKSPRRPRLPPRLPLRQIPHHLPPPKSPPGPR